MARWCLKDEPPETQRPGREGCSRRCSSWGTWPSPGAATQPPGMCVCYTLNRCSAVEAKLSMGVVSSTNEQNFDYLKNVYFC